MRRRLHWLAAALAATLLAGCSPLEERAAAPTAPPVRSEAQPEVGRSTAPAPSPAAEAQRRRRSTRRRPPQSLVAAKNARDVARILVAAETAVRDPAVTGQELATAGQTQQRVYRLLTRRPRLAPRVVAAVPPALRPVAQRNVTAGRLLAELVTPQPDLPDWKIVPPAPARTLLRHYRRAAARFGLSWEYLAAINLVETRMGRIRGRSTAGAQGPMQFMPQTWEAYGRGDVSDEGDAIEAAARYLADYGAPADMDAALWHYNHSNLYVEAVTAYAEVMRADARAYRGYYHWQVYYETRRGSVLLPVGYGS